MKNAANNDHGMRPHDVNHRVSSNFREIVGADHGIVVPPPYIIHTRFELDEIVHMRSILDRPFHVANDATERKSSLGISARQLLESMQHPVLIEVTVTKICLGVGSKLELTSVLGSRRIDACRSQTLQMTMMLYWTHNVDGLIPALKAVLYEWQQYAILFVVTVKKRTDVTYVAQLGTGKESAGATVFFMVYTSPYYGSPAGRDNPPPAMHLGSRGKEASTTLLNSMRLSQPNVYRELWYWSGGIRVPAAPAGDS